MAKLPIQIDDFEYPGTIGLPKLEPGFTTIYIAAMELTGRDPTFLPTAALNDDFRKLLNITDDFVPVGMSIGFGTNNQPPWHKPRVGGLREIIALNPKTWSVFVVLFNALQNGKLPSKQPEYIPETGILDPFLSLVRNEDIERFLNGLPPDSRSQAVVVKKSPRQSRNPRGPRPVKRDGIRDQMIKDYAGRPAELRGEKIIFLQNKYVAAKDTLTDARDEALVTLENTGKSSDTGK